MTRTPSPCAPPRRRIASAFAAGWPSPTSRRGGAMRRARRPRSIWRWRATRRSCRIVEAGGAPIGYAQAVEIGLWGEARPDDVAPGTWDIDLFIASAEHRGQRARRGGARAAHRGGVRHDAGRGLLRRRVDQERGGRAGLRAGGLPLAADLARPAARALLADAEGAAGPATASSLSWPAATNSRETVQRLVAGDLLQRRLDPGEPVALAREPGLDPLCAAAQRLRA